MNLLELNHVTKEYCLRTRNHSWFTKIPRFRAVKDVTLTIKKGECLGLVGESGSGKSTLAKLIMNIESLTSGEIRLNGKTVHGKKVDDLTVYKQIQLVFQDSSTSLYPHMSVRDILEEPIYNYFPEARTQVEERCLNVLKLVDLDRSYLSRYPHQLSGGQKQRVCIARALAVKPDMIIFDESIASLDPVSQREIIQMLNKIKEIEQISYLFITHDLQSTKLLCERIAVMYQGEIVEIFSDWKIDQLKHDYSRLLFQTLDQKMNSNLMKRSLPDE